MSELSVEYIEQMLTGQKDQLLSATPTVISDGKGFLSTVTKLQLCWSKSGDQNLPRKIVVKRPTATIVLDTELGSAFRGSDLIQRMHNAEVLAYRYFSHTGRPPFPMARFFHGENMTAEGTGLLVLEFKEGQSLGINQDWALPQVETMVRNIAKSHAFSINQGNVNQFGCFAVDLAHSFIRKFPDVVDKIQAMHPTIMNLTTTDVEQIVSFSNNYTAKMANPERFGYPLVVGFGDIQTNNILWKLSSTGQITNEVSVMLDLQWCHRGTFAFDLCAVSFWSLSSKDRENHLHRLLREYHDVVQRNTDGNAPVSFECVLQEFEKCSVMHAAMYLPTIAEIGVLNRVLFGMDEDRGLELVKKCARILEDFALNNNNNSCEIDG